MSTLPFIVPTVICRCGHQEHWERFNEDALGLELPPNTFRCPGCGWQWERLRIPEYYGTGEFARYRIEIRDVQAPFLATAPGCSASAPA